MKDKNRQINKKWRCIHKQGDIVFNRRTGYYRCQKCGEVFYSKKELGFINSKSFRVVNKFLKWV